MADLENKVIANSICLEPAAPRWAALLAFLIGLLSGNLAIAQASPAYAGLHAPLVRSMDRNNVNLLAGPSFYVTDVTIGDPQVGGLEFSRTFNTVHGGLFGSWTVSPGSEQVVGTNGWVAEDYSAYLGYGVTYGHGSQVFELTGGAEAGGTYISQAANGETLEIDVFNNQFTDRSRFSFYKRDGSRLIFERRLLRSVEKPNGIVITYNYASVLDSGYTREILRSVTSNAGYMLHFQYGSPGSGLRYEVSEHNFEITKVIGINTRIYPCDPLAVTCADAFNGVTWPSVTFRRESAGLTLVGSYSDGRLSKFKSEYSNAATYIPGSWAKAELSIQSAAGNSISLGSYQATRFTNYIQTSHVSGSGSFNYRFDTQGGSQNGIIEPLRIIGGSVTGPASYTSSWTTDQQCQFTVFGICSPDLLSTVTVNGRTTRYAYGCANPECMMTDWNPKRLIRVTQHDGDYTDVQYDKRGNILKLIKTPKPGSGLAVIVETAVYPEVGSLLCVNRKTCNQPISTKDAAGNQTDYVYEAARGDLLSKIAPAPGGTGPYATVRPTTNYTYENVGGSGIWKLKTTSICAIAATCSVSASNSVVQFNYNHPNYLLSDETKSSGDGAITATTALTYTALGDLESTDGPLPGTFDKSWAFYDVMRRKVATVGPDPDEGGPLLPRAQKLTLNAAGLVTVTDIGTVASPQNWASLTVLKREETAYDSYGRKTRQLVRDYTLAGGAIQRATNWSYDGAGRVQCEANRMNPASFLQAVSACVQTTQNPSFGPDRITRTSYTANGDISKIEEGLGTTLLRNARVMTYLAPGQVSTISDANGNRTTYSYDGFNRLIKTRFPSATTAGTSSTTDYTAETFDNFGRPKTQRTRSGYVFTLSYDNLSRVVSRIGAGNSTTYAFAYDVKGRTLSTTNVLSGVSTIASATYDAFDRQITDTTPNGTVSYVYDAADRRARLTWPNGYFVTYEYDRTNALKAIRDNTAALLVSYNYDNLGRRSQIVRGNSTTTNYAYEASGGLDSLSHDLAGTVNDTASAFDHNSVGQITARNISNAAYRWNASTLVNDAYVPNGLNQIGSRNGVTFSYDTQGNLTSDGNNTYQYDKENRLISSPSRGITLKYDALGRLASASAALIGTTQFLYDGSQLIWESGEYGSQRLYVHGVGPDKPVLAIENGTKYWYHADERGSIVARSDIAGNLLGAVNTYDEYGIPSATNAGRFQYTGQAWIPELGMYYYKARIYAPALGRFLQTDPIGYDDQINLYAYVGNDPVNKTDPTGMEGEKEVEKIVVTEPRRKSPPPPQPLPDVVTAPAMQTADTASPTAQQSLQCPLVTPSGKFGLGPNADPRFAPEFASVLSSAFAQLNAQGVTPYITSGFRTSNDQARMRSGASGTNPAASVSNHQLGLSIDLNTRTPDFPTIRAELTGRGLTWGGNFRSKDPPHFQLPPAGTRANSAQAAICEAENGR